MNLSELGFDYSNLSSCTIKQKNLLSIIPSIILLSTILPLFLVFLILFILHTPVEIDDITRYYNDPEYMSFFKYFLGITGLICSIFLVFLIKGLFKKPNDYIIMDKDSLNFEIFYYINDTKKKEYIYLTKDFVIIYSKKSNISNVINDYKIIREYFEKYIFWKSFPSKNFIIKKKTNKTVLKYKKRESPKTVYQIRYSFSNDAHIVPRTVIESINKTKTGNSTITAFRKLYFENINRSQHFSIIPEINLKISEITQ